MSAATNGMDRRATLDAITETRLALLGWQQASQGTDAARIYRALAQARAALARVTA